MRIGLIAVDGHGGFPNLALMRISAWYRQRCDHVEWWNGFTHYDRVYLSKIFTFTPDFDTVIHADEVITECSGVRSWSGADRPHGRRASVGRF